MQRGVDQKGFLIMRLDKHADDENKQQATRYPYQSGDCMTTHPIGDNVALSMSPMRPCQHRTGHSRCSFLIRSRLALLKLRPIST